MRTVMNSVGIGALALSQCAGVASGQAITTFDTGSAGWTFSGFDGWLPTGGNPGANAGLFFPSVFGAEIRNRTNPDVLGDLGRYGAFEITLDIKVNSINAGADGELARELIVDLRDNNDDENVIRNSVWFSLGIISQADCGQWCTFSVVIDDPDATQMPGGWGGSGGEDPVTGQSALPPGVTFADILANVDEFAFSTLRPGRFFFSADFDLQVDNIGIRPVTPPCLADVNGDGAATPADFSAWIAAFNTRAQGCDQNGDRECTAADFSAWIANFNAGC